MACQWIRLPQQQQQHPQMQMAVLAFAETMVQPSAALTLCNILNVSYGLSLSLSLPRHLTFTTPLLHSQATHSLYLKAPLSPLPSPSFALPHRHLFHYCFISPSSSSCSMCILSHFLLVLAPVLVFSLLVLIQFRPRHLVVLLF